MFYQLAVQQVHKHKSGTLRNPYLYAYFRDKTNNGMCDTSTSEHDIWHDEDKDSVRSARTTRDKGKLNQSGTGTALQHRVRVKFRRRV